MKLLTTRPHFRDLEHEKAWLIRTTLHRACDMARAAERRDLPLETAEVLPGGEMPGPPHPFPAVQALPAKYNAVIHLYYYEGYSIKEISKLLQIPSLPWGTPALPGAEQAAPTFKGGCGMNRQNYRAAFDAVDFSPDFEERTLQKLATHAARI